MPRLLSRLTEGAKKARMERALVRHSFAPFVSDNSVTTLGPTVPVFCFHAVTASEFESLLIHLRDNNYQTLTADGLVEYLRGDQPIEKQVVLTFDDGWRSTWTVAYPLLKKYGFRGISFLVPSWMSDEPPSATIVNHWNGGMTLDEVHLLERDRPYLSWSEAKIMQDDQVFEFQSHTQSHDTVFTSNELVDFVNPTYQRAPHKIPIVGDASFDPWERSKTLGMPLYTIAPRLTGATRYHEDEATRNACIDFVKQHGGERFFLQANWRIRLQELIKDRTDNGKHQSTQERDAGIKHELQASKEAIESQLGNRVRHFCFPFYAGSEIAASISEELGYQSNYWGWKPISDRRTKHYGQNHLYDALDETDYSTGDVLQGRRNNSPGDDPFRIVRVPGDYIHRLPGVGRRSLSSMFVQKCLRNLKK